MPQESIPVIVITGGPCAGKTTVLSFLQQKLADLGITVVVVGEGATEFILSGIQPRLLNVHTFQSQLLQHILEKEARWKKIAALMFGERKVIICDRGALDTAAYTTPQQFELILGELSETMVGLRDRRYDGVIFLHSVAVDLPEMYTTLNNPARHESLAQALERNEKTLAAWTGHPHLRIIGNNTSIAGKLNRVLQAVYRILGIPTPLETERKWLVSSSVDLSLLPKPVRQVHIIQHYLINPNPDDEERVRYRGEGQDGTFYHTTKRFIRPGLRHEFERQITRKDYTELLRRADPSSGVIDKRRSCFVFKNQYFELDEFTAPAGLVLLELELIEEGESIMLPFRREDLTEVTGNLYYHNRAIARRLAKSK